MRRLSFRSSSRNRKASQSPPPSRGTVRAASPRPSKPIAPTTPTPASRKASFTNNSRPTFSQTNSSNKLAPAAEVIIQRATTPHLRPPSAQQQPPAASEPPSTPSAASGRSTTNSPSLTTTTATTPGTDTTNFSPTVKAPASMGPEKQTLSSRPNLADRRISSNNALNTNGYKAANGGNASVLAPHQQPVEEKKRGRGMSLRRFFGSSSSKNAAPKNSAPKERPPRAAMTYGDLA